MASNGSGGSGSGGDLVGNEPRMEEETMGVQTGSPSTKGGSTGTGEMSAPVGNPPTGSGGGDQAMDDGGERRAALSQVSTPVEVVVEGIPTAAAEAGGSVGLTEASNTSDQRATVTGDAAPVGLVAEDLPSMAAEAGDTGGDDKMVEGGGDRRAAVGMGGAPVNQVAEGSPAAGETGSAGGGSTEAALYEALTNLDRERPQIGTHEPISARTTGSSTTEAAGEEPIIDDVEKEGAEAEEIQRDPSKGKTPITDEGSERQRAEGLPRGGVAFVPPQGSSSACPTYYDDFAELMGEERLAELYMTDPGLVSVITRMREEHVAEQDRRNEEIRLAMEREATLREDEVEETFEEMEEGPRVSAVEEARKVGRPSFDEDGIPHLPVPHLIVICGFEPYKPKREKYGAGVVRRDPEGHRAETWAEV